MNETNSTLQPFNNSTDSACERCGSFDALEFAGKVLCPDCIQMAGCACAGHGSDED